MKITATCLLTVAMLQFSPISASAANKYPPGPGNACPDTLKISQVQNVTALCHPATLDTVLGIGGIVIGFDAKPSAFATYFQTRGGGPFSGVQAFTGATNYNSAPFNLTLGDSIVVYGTTQEFPATNGTTEIEGPDVNQSTNDIVIRKVSSGNPLPPYQIVTTTQVNWIPSSIGNQGEMWESALVRLRGPLRVGRTSTQGGNPLLPSSSFLVVRVASPSDSVLIDGNTLATFTPPAAGTIVDSVQGIVNQSTTSGTNSYRVQLRDGNDIFVAAPPNLTDAYPIEDNVLRLVFDRDVYVPSAETEANYSLASGIDGSTVDLATVEGGSGRFVRLAITSVRTDGDVESVSASGIGAASCPGCIMSQQSRTFFNGVLDVKTVQAPNPDSLPGSCVDRSRFAGIGSAAGLRISVRGVGVGQFGSLQYLEDADGGKRGGISVFGPSAPLTVGHQFLVAGQIQEFGGETEIVANVYLTDEADVGPPAPADTKNITVLTDTTCDATLTIENGEDKEGMLVRLYNLTVAEQRTAGQSFFAAGPCCANEDTILVSNLNGILGSFTPPDSGSSINVTGILHFANGFFRICPRNVADVSVVGVPAPSKLAQDVLCNGVKIGEFHLNLKESFIEGRAGGIPINGGFKLTNPRGRDQECWCQEYEIFQVIQVSDSTFGPAQGKFQFVDPLPTVGNDALNWDYAPFYWNHQNRADLNHENQNNSGIKPKGKEDQGEFTLFFSDRPQSRLSRADTRTFTFDAVTCLACVNEKLDKETDFHDFAGEFKTFTCIRWGFLMNRNVDGTYKVDGLGPYNANPPPQWVKDALDQFNAEKIGFGHWTWLDDNKKPAPPPLIPPPTLTPQSVPPALATEPTVVVSFDAATQALTVGPAPVAFLDDHGTNGPTAPQYVADPALATTLCGGVYWLYAHYGNRVQFINDSNALNLYDYDEKVVPGSKSNDDDIPAGPASPVNSYLTGDVPTLVYSQSAAPFTLYGPCQAPVFPKSFSQFLQDLWGAVQSASQGLGYFLAPLQDLGALTQGFTISGSTLARAYLGVPGPPLTGVEEAPPRVYDLGSSFPNPSAGGATIVYSLAREEPAVLAVFDMNGRLVKELVNGAIPAGPHRATWDGTDRFGHAAPAGLYMYRLKTPSYTSSRRLALMR